MLSYCEIGVTYFFVVLELMEFCWWKFTSGVLHVSHVNYIISDDYLARDNFLRNAVMYVTP